MESHTESQTWSQKMYPLVLIGVLTITVLLLVVFLPRSGNSEERQVPDITGKWVGPASDSILAEQIFNPGKMSLFLVKTRSGGIEGMVTLNYYASGDIHRDYKLLAEVSASFTPRSGEPEAGTINGTWAGEYQGGYVRINFSATVDGDQMVGTYSSSRDFPDNSLTAALIDLEVKGGTFSLIKD